MLLLVAGGLVVLAPGARATLTTLPPVIEPLTIGCLGGVCYWIGGTGAFSSTAHWSISSGGASCGCTPAFADDLIFDGASGTGTATQDVSSFSSGTIYTTGTSVVVAASSNHWTFHGSISDAGSHITYGTSTFEFASNGAGIYEADAYNVIIDSSIGVTLYTPLKIHGVLTINGTLTYKNARVFLYGSAGVHDPLIFGPSGSQVAGGGTDGNLFFIGSTYQNIPRHADYEILNLEPLSDSALMNLTGDVTTVILYFRLDSVGAWSFDTKGFDLNATYLFRAYGAAGSETTGNLLHFRDSHLRLASVIFDSVGKTSPQLENSTWTVTGAWNNNLATVASWDPGHSSVTLTFPSGVATSSVKFANPSVVSEEFWNLTVASAYSSAAWVNMTGNSLHVQEALRIGPDSSGHTTFVATGFGVTVGCLILDAHGSFTGTSNETIGANCNHPPVLSPSVSSATATVNVSYVQAFNATDPDGQTLSWGFSSNNVYLHFGASNHTVYGIPRALGVFWVNVTVNDTITTSFDNYTLLINPAPPGPSDFVILMTILFLTIALVALLTTAWWYDTVFPFILAGIIAFLMAFEAWSVTASIPAVLGIVTVGVVLMAIPIDRIVDSD